MRAMYRPIGISLVMAAAFGPCAQARVVRADLQDASATSRPAPAAQEESANPAAGHAAAGDYVSGAAISDMFEIQSSQLALRMAQSAAIKAFARQMIAEHTATTASLKATVARAGLQIMPPAQPDPRRQAMLAALQAAPSGAFDGAYLQQQVAAHKEALALHSDYAQSGDNAALRQLAGRIVPKIQHHLMMAQQLAGGGGQATP